MKKYLLNLRTGVLAGMLGLAVGVNAQIALTKTLPPAGTTYKYTSAIVPGSLPLPEQGANKTWDYSSLTPYGTGVNISIRPASEMTPTEQSLMPNAVYFKKYGMGGKDYYKDDGNYLVKIGALSNQAEENNQQPSVFKDTIFEFNLPYQATTTFYEPVAAPSHNTMTYAGYGTLLIYDNTYNDVVMFTNEPTGVNEPNYYFYLMTPHFHLLAALEWYGNPLNTYIFNFNKLTPPAPVAPSNLTVTPVNSMALNWQDNSDNEDGFRIYSSQDTANASNWSMIATVGVNETYYHHTGLTEGVEYFYRVQAYNEGGVSAYSNVASAVEIAGITNLHEDRINIYPNPANNQVTITNLPTSATISIVDLTGKTVYSTSTHQSELQINTTDIISGVYFVKVESNGNITTEKLMINK